MATWGGWGEDKGVEDVKPQNAKQLLHRNRNSIGLMCSMVTVVTTILLYPGNWLREDFRHSYKNSGHCVT